MGSLDLIMLLVFLVVVDETIGRGIMRFDMARASQFRQNGLGQLLTKLDTPLIVRVDVPDGTLDKDLVFIHGNERTKSGRSQLLEQERVGRLVALEDLVRDNVFLDVGTHLGTNLLLVLTDHQGFSLSKEVGQQNVVVNTVANRVESLDGGKEITRNHLGTLMDELIEGVLTVGTRLAPDDGTSLSLDLFTRTRDVLAIGFHVTLN